jgi:hypothetical protein
MAVPRLDEDEIQQLMAHYHVGITYLEDEAKMIRLAEALKADNVLVIVTCLVLYARRRSKLSLRAALALQDAVRRNATLTRLELVRDNGHLSIIFEGVAASQSIRTLDVAACKNISLQDIAALANLETLYLSKCTFGRGVFTAFMAALMPNGRLHGLHSLGLNNCRVDNARVEVIAQMLRSNSSLKVLNLSTNPIGDEGAILLADVFSNPITVTNLSLRGCGIGNVGAIALAGLLKKNTKIKAVDLRSNAVADEGRQALLKASLWNTFLEWLYIGDGLGRRDQRRMSRTLMINRYRKIYLEQDHHSTISPYLYPRIFANVSNKPSVLFLFLQENREMFIPHLPEPSGLSCARKRKAP